VIGRARHLADDRLFDCYVAARAGEPLDPPAVEHLADCAECESRFADLSRFMDNLRSDADAETDALFPADWRSAQHQTILNRLEHVGHAARVITFPARLVAQRMARGTGVRVSPWPAVAAAACLVVGVAVGVFYDSRTHRSMLAVARPAQLSAVPAAAPAAASPAAAPFDTDAFLSELERALGGPQTPELMSLDELTPHVREIALNTR
jgi:hypothetical protein